MNTEQLPELHMVLGHSALATAQMGPPGLRLQAFPPHIPALVGIGQLREGRDAAEPDLLGPGFDSKGRDGRGRRSVRKRLRRRFHYENALTAEPVEEKVSNQASIVHVQPLRGGDEDPVVISGGP